VWRSPSRTPAKSSPHSWLPRLPNRFVAAPSAHAPTTQASASAWQSSRASPKQPWNPHPHPPRNWGALRHGATTRRSTAHRQMTIRRICRTPREGPTYVGPKIGPRPVRLTPTQSGVCRQQRNHAPCGMGDTGLEPVTPSLSSWCCVHALRQRSTLIPCKWHGVSRVFGWRSAWLCDPFLDRLCRDCAASGQGRRWLARAHRAWPASDCGGTGHP
jgi:hypothetical protein